MKRRPILIIGDIHGYFTVLDAFIKRLEPLLVLQCGDFGIWPGRNIDRLAAGFKTDAGQTVPIHFCDGNHENHHELRKLCGLTTAALEVGDCVFYQPRGSTITLPNGHVVLFAGGADSVDKDMRTPGLDWFPEEILTENDFEHFPDIPSVNIVISHSAPASLKLPPLLDAQKYPDPSRDVLDKVLQRYRPKQWFCAHYHTAFSGKIKNCQIQALDCGHSHKWKDEINKDGYAVYEI